MQHLTQTRGTLMVVSGRRVGGGKRSCEHKHSIVALFAVGPDINHCRLVFCVTHSHQNNGELAFIVVSYFQFSVGLWFLTCFPSIAPTQLGKFHSLQKSWEMSAFCAGDGKATKLSFKANQIALETSEIIEHTVVNPILQLAATLLCEFPEANSRSMTTNLSWVEIGILCVGACCMTGMIQLTRSSKRLADILK